MIIMHEWQTAAFDTQKRLLGVRWLFGVSGDHPDAPADPPQKDSWVSNGFSEIWESSSARNHTWQTNTGIQMDPTSRKRTTNLIICMYIYRERERERKRAGDMHTDMYVFDYYKHLCISMYT